MKSTHTCSIRGAPKASFRRTDADADADGGRWTRRGEARRARAVMRAVCVARVRVETPRVARARVEARRARDVRETRGGRDERCRVVGTARGGRDARLRAMVTEEDRDEDDSGDEAGAGGVEGWHGKYTFSTKRGADGARGETGGNDEAETKRKTVRELLLSRDPGLNQTLISSGTSISQLFDQDKWERHRMVDRFITELVSIPQSTVFLRLLKPCLALAAYTAMLSVLPSVLERACAHFGWNVLIPNLNSSALVLPASVHSFLGSLCGLVLVFRTNSSYGRFVEGRTAWGSLIKHVRDVARLSMYIPDATLRRRLLELSAAYAYVLKTRLRSGRTRSDPKDPTAFRDIPDEAVRRCVTEAPLAEEVLASAKTGNRCLYTLLLISKTLKAALEAGTPREIHWKIEEAVSGMGLAGGVCERIVATPIPLSFSRHSTRSLVIWLLTLPFALIPTMGWLSIPSIFTLAYLVLGIDEIGIQIEEPFATLPLTPLCATIERDVSIAIAGVDVPDVVVAR